MTEGLKSGKKGTSSETFGRTGNRLRGHERNWDTSLGGLFYETKSDAKSSYEDQNRKAGCESYES